MTAKHDSLKCLCDEVYRTHDDVCEPGLEQLCKAVKSKFDPKYFYQGVAVSEEEALSIATKILINANYPMALGLQHLGVTSQQKVIDLMRYIGGVIDSGGAEYALPRVGAVKSTVGEIAKRSQCIVLMNCKLWQWKPRLFKKLKEGNSNRKLVWIGDGPCEQGKCDQSIVVPGINLEELLLVATAKITNSPIRDANFEGIEVDSSFEGNGVVEVIAQFMDELVQKNYVSVFYSQPSKNEFDAIGDLVVSLVKKLNSKTRAIAMEISEQAIESSASQVLSWSTGFGNSVDVSCNQPRSFNGEFGAHSVLQRRECDALISFGTFESNCLDWIAQEHLEAIPKVSFVWQNESAISSANTLQVRNLSLTGDTFARFDDLTFELEGGSANEKLSRFLVQLINNLRTTLVQKS